MAKKNKELEVNTKTRTLESLILEGENTQIQITIEYPTSNGTVPVGAIIKPINSVDWNNLFQQYGQDANKFNIATLAKGLYTQEGEQLPPELLMKMPAGVVDSILKQIMAISGIQEDKEEQQRMIRELMGF